MSIVACKSGRPNWWARYTDNDGKEQFLNCFDTEGREILDVSCQLPVGTTIKIGCGTQAQIRETTVTTEIPEERK
jgi:hypothetical protein